MTNNTHRMTPAPITAVAILFLSCWLMLRLSHSAVCSVGSWVPASIVNMASAITAYSIGLFFCLQIAAEHRRGGLRRAWILLCLFAAVSVIRHVFDTRLIDLLYPGYWGNPVSAFLREGFAALSLIFLAAGILMLTLTFLRLRIGFSLKWIDYAAVAVVLSVLGSILLLRSNLPTVALASPIPMWMQAFSQFLLVFGASGSILLIRLTEQMGGGRLAITLRLITAHIVLRAFLVLAAVLENHFHWEPLLMQHLLSMSAPWLFALAASYRVEVAHSARQQASLWGISELDAAA